MKFLKSIVLLCMTGGCALMGSSLKDAIENATLDGWLRGKYFYSDGADGSGQGYQMFFLPNVHSGEVNGYSLTVGLFAAYGPGVPDAVTSDNSIGGSRAPRIDQSSAPDVFNISNLYINKTFESSKTTVRVGQMNIVSALNAGTSYGDRGIGGMIENKDIQGIRLYASAYDSWMTDNIMLAMNQATTYGIGNNIFILGVESDKDFQVKDLGFKLYYSYAEQLYNMMMFGDIHYKFHLDNGVSIGLLGQIAGTVMNSHAAFHTKGTNLSNYFSALAGLDPEGAPYGGYAKTRGIYNLQVNIKAGGYTGKLGYIGSFGQGYGTMLDSKGAFNVGGQLWNGIIAGGLMGFGWTGTGGVKNTSLQAVYFTHHYKLNRVGFGIDAVWVGGKNRYPFMKKGSKRIRQSSKNRGSVIPARSDNVTMDARIVELSPQISYAFTDKFTGSVVYSQMLSDDLLMGRAVVTLKYDFD
ncbi:hypothetical protein BKH46_03225 [Helicobacter sp. 12S02634-8]|uniref:major outer membrane protein n=1 Tax=Helicobacter sp. 12S02634-8 TaxID=1476199 RepID=UPI000BA5CB60|nr:major outer membrane protein [Helicobacter sp. 12S02634-8]PAF47855.1 hypothetical protein BKH46_03225 [Helicobacter sp. 12S02634-8]